MGPGADHGTSAHIIGPGADHGVAEWAVPEELMLRGRSADALLELSAPWGYGRCCVGEVLVLRGECRQRVGRTGAMHEHCATFMLLVSTVPWGIYSTLCKL